MQHLGTGIGSFGPRWGREEQTESVNILLMIGTGVSHNPWILAFKGNPVSYVQANGNRNLLSNLVG